MRQQLLRKAYFKTLHIALFFSFILISIEAKAQTILVPGDVVFVSINSVNDSFEIIPLIDIREGTRLYVNNGLWSNEKVDFDSGSEVEISFLSNIEAGTSIKLDSNILDGIEINGQLTLSPESETLFLYQKEEGVFRFVYGIGWGQKDPDAQQEYFGSDLPAALTEVTKNYLSLGDLENYQYYIRNGASGTSRMLSKLVTDAAHWKGKNSLPYQSFGTSFNILKPPVILFDQSLNTISETEDVISLNVAIYEHDGSKLTVDVAFDSFNSSLGSDEIMDFKSTEINFSGLIGNAVYEIKLPIKADNIYEGTETGFFELRNLSKGNFGDFVTHTLLVQDNEKPKVKLQPLAINNEQAVIVYNIESTEVDVSNWTITKGKNSFTIPDNYVLEAGGKLVISSKKAEDYVGATYSMLLLDEKDISSILKPGLIKIFDRVGSVIDEVVIEEQKREEVSNTIAVSDVQSKATAAKVTELGVVVDTPKSFEIVPGWKEIAFDETLIKENAETKFYLWSEVDGQYVEFESQSAVPSSRPLLAFLDEDQIQGISKREKEKEEIEQNELQIIISSTDKNNNKVIDEIEGLNKVINLTKEPIQVGFLQKEVMELASLVVKPVIFSKTRNGTESLLATDVISPNEVFWLKLEEAIDETKLDIDLSKMVFDQETVATEKFGVLELILSREGKTEKVVFNFKDTGSDLTSTLTLDDNVQLLIPGKSYSSFSLKNGTEDFVSKDLFLNGDYEFSFSSSIMGSEDGKYVLKVGKWGDIPSDLMILVEDLVDQKVYELDENWEISFDYSNNLIDRKESFYSKVDLIQPRKENRYVFKFVSKQQYIEDEEVDTPDELTLNQNYPNPFNPLTTLSFYIPEAAEVRLSVFNIVGQPVALLINQSMAVGEHKVDWDASDMPSGMYIYQLEVGTKIMTRKMTLVK